MITSFARTIIISMILLFIPGLLLIAQEKDYALNKDKSEISILVKTEKSQFTVDNILSKEQGRPLIGARIYDLDINMDTVGTWSQLSTKENIWKLSLDVLEAKAFFIGFDDFYLPPGSKLYVYNKNNLKNAILYNPEDNPQGGAYSIEGLYGDNAVIEYVPPKNSKERPRLHFSSLGYKYQEGLIGSNEDPSDIYLSCMININCAQGANWQTQKKGVVYLRTKRKDNQYNLCSGTLINNTNNDKKPYILTAYHCLENVDILQSNNFEALFEYESTDCENRRPTYKFHRGGDVKVANSISGGSDGALILLTGAIPDEWDVYFNGWDKTNDRNTITSGSIIHHPNGSIKKISLFNESPASVTWTGGANHAFWEIGYTDGATYKGSSGAPLFNQNGLVIGTLTGGNNSCLVPGGRDVYGKLWYHWDQAVDGDLHMSKYLDPLNTGQTSLAGLNNNNSELKELILAKTDANILLNTDETIDILSGNGGYRVESSNKNIAEATINGAQIIVKAKELGRTTLKIIDAKSKSKEVNIIVRNNIDIIMSDNIIKASVADENDIIKQVRLIDLDGDVFYDKKNIGDRYHDIDISQFRSGKLYIIQIKTEKGGTKSRKIIWQN